MPPQITSRVTGWYRNQYDTAPPLEIDVFDDQDPPQPLDVDTAGITVFIDIARQSGSHYYSPRGRIVEDRAMTAHPTINGRVSYFPEPGDLDQPGEFHVMFKVVYPDGSQQGIPMQYPMWLKVRERIGGS